MGWSAICWPHPHRQTGPPVANDGKAPDDLRGVELAQLTRPAYHHRKIAQLIASFFRTPIRRRQDDFSRIREIQIYYGTMFGSAEHYARALAHELLAHRSMRVTIHDLDAFSAASFQGERLSPTRLFVFVVSTHFAGSPSPSAERFCNWIATLDGQRREIANLGDGSGTDKTSSTVSAVSNPVVQSGPHYLGLTQANSRFPISARNRQQPLRGMQYAVFGIGDSMYLTFNATGKFVDAKLKELGASRLLPVGLGDCSNDVEGAYKAWESSLLHRLPRRMSITLVQDLRLASATAFRRLTRHSPLVTPTGVSVELKVPPTEASVQARRASDRRQSTTASPLSVRDNFGRVVELRFLCLNLREAGDIARIHRQGSPSVRTSVATESFGSRPRTPRVALFDETPFAEIVPVDRVGPAPPGVSYASTPLRQRSYGVFKVKLLNPDVSYASVSTLAIFPQNNPRHVEAVAAAFHFDLDAEIELFVDETRHPNPAQLKAEQRALPFPTPCTIRTALTEFLELRTVTPEFIRVASGYVVSMGDKEVLESLASTESSIAYRTQIQDQHKGLLDLIAMAPTLEIPWNVFVNIAQPIKPRYFTIASSPRVSPRELDLAIALGSPHQQQGLATSFLERMLSSRSATPVPIRGFISVSRFKFRDDGKSPMVFIACGVGVAPMRAIIQERLMLWAQNMSTERARSPSASSVAAVPKQLLFLGTANEDSIVFLKDLRYWEQQMVVQVHHAYSDDRRYPRRYVQDIVASRIEEIVQLVNASAGTRVFVCGRLAMVRRIREIFEADQRQRGRAWFTTLHKSGRFVEEAYD